MQQPAKNIRGSAAQQLSIFPTSTLSFVILRVGDMRKINLRTHYRQIRRLQFIDTLIGAVLCAIAALGVSAVAAGHKWGVAVPLAFTAILLLISSLYGTRAGVFGTVLAAIIFAAFLFNPVGSLYIGSEAAKGNLAWMLLLGISFSFLFAPPTGGLGRD